MEAFDNSVKTSSVIHVLPRINETRSSKLSSTIQDSSSSMEEDVVGRTNNLYKEQPVSYWSALCVFAILGAAIIFSSTQTLIPWRNLFIHPEFWWEDMIRHGVIYFGISIILPTARDAYCIFQYKEFISIKWHLKFYIPLVSQFIALCCLQQFIWQNIFGNEYLMPLGFTFPKIVATLTSLFVIFPLIFPSELKRDPKYKERLKGAISYGFVQIIIIQQEPILDSIFTMLTDYQTNGISAQCLISVIIPAFRRIVEWILPKFFNKAVGYQKGWTKLDENEAATFCMETWINIQYTHYIAIRLSHSYISTQVCILGVEFCINLYYCIQIIRRHRKIGGIDRNSVALLRAEVNSSIVSFLTAEFIETLTPLIYAIALLMAYYGPNATIMTGIKNEYFGVPAITNIQSALIVLFVMAGIDLIGGVVLGVLLKYFCKMDISSVICRVLQRYWIILAIFIGGDITHVSCS